MCLRVCACVRERMCVLATRTLSWAPNHPTSGTPPEHSCLQRAMLMLLRFAMTGSCSEGLQAQRWHGVRTSPLRPEINCPLTSNRNEAPNACTKCMQQEERTETHATEKNGRKRKPRNPSRSKPPIPHLPRWVVRFGGMPTGARGCRPLKECEDLCDNSSRGIRSESEKKIREG